MGIPGAGKGRTHPRGARTWAGSGSTCGTRGRSRHRTAAGPGPGRFRSLRSQNPRFSPQKSLSRGPQVTKGFYPTPPPKFSSPVSPRLWKSKSFLQVIEIQRFFPKKAFPGSYGLLNPKDSSCKKPSSGNSGAFQSNFWVLPGHLGHWWGFQVDSGAIPDNCGAFPGNFLAFPANFGALPGNFGAFQVILGHPQVFFWHSQVILGHSQVILGHSRRSRRCRRCCSTCTRCTASGTSSPRPSSPA